MVKKAEDVFKDALALNADERQQLVKLLIEQPAGSWATPEIEQAWQEECDRREAAMDSGEMEMIAHDEVMRRARAKLAR